MSNPVQAVHDMLAAKAAQQHDNWHPPKLRFRPSEIGGCWREIYYRLAGNQPSALPARSMLLFTDGDMHHNIVRQMMQEAGVKLGDLIFEADGQVTETGVSIRTVQFEHGGKVYDITVSTRVDGQVEVAGEMVLLEIKSIGKYKFEKFAGAFLKGGEAEVMKHLRDEDVKRAGARPKPAHENRRFWLQFQATLLATDRPRMYVVFKNRDTGEVGFADKDGGMHGFMVHSDGAAQTEVQQRCAVVLKALESGRPPSTEFSDGSTSCRMCNFYGLCWGAVQKEA